MSLTHSMPVRACVFFLVSLVLARVESRPVYSVLCWLECRADLSIEFCVNSRREQTCVLVLCVLNV